MTHLFLLGPKSFHEIPMNFLHCSIKIANKIYQCVAVKFLRLEISQGVYIGDIGLLSHLPKENSQVSFMESPFMCVERR
jgi:hypothetical protein